MNSPWRNTISAGLFTLTACLALPAWLNSLAADRTPSPSEQFRALSQEYQTAQTEFSKLYQQAKTDAEREKLRNEKMPDAKKFAPRIWDLAEKNAKDPAALDALVWLTTNAYQSEEAAKALAALARDHAASDKVGIVCGVAPYISGSAAGEFLKAVVEKNSKRELQAQACQGLYTFSLMAEPAQAEKYLALLEKDYSQIQSSRGPGTIAEFVKSEKEHNEIFGIGRVAPNTEGEDIDGKKFKLSDYRGKVVVIDFWGDW